MIAPDNTLLPIELGPVLRTVLDAVVVVTPDGRVIGWNGVAEEVFGHSSEAAIGRRLSELIIPEDLRAAHEDGLVRLARGEAPRVLDRRIEITALRADGTEFPVELSITTAQTAQGEVFVGFLRDISARVKAEEQLRRQALEARLMFDIASMAAAADSFEDALCQGLAAICELSGWPVGHAFNVSGDRPAMLISTDIWHEAEPGAAQALRERTETIEWAPGIGLPGTILETGEPLWLSDLESAPNFYRKGLGYRGAFGFPLQSEGRIIAILEFFARSPSKPDAELLLTVRTLGEQVGRVFERRRRQDREALLVGELNHRAKNLLMVIQAIARQTFGKAVTPESAMEAFLGRLTALSRAHDLLLASDMRDLGLRDAIEAAIECSGNSLDRFAIEGENLRVPAGSGTSIVLAIHELCTNAVKYGALSVPGGCVDVRWGLPPGSDSFLFEWRERDGPPVSQPERRGFGSTLLARTLESELGGQVEFEFPPEGFRCRFTVPRDGRGND